jgi:hypothetical protein
MNGPSTQTREFTAQLDGGEFKTTVSRSDSDAPLTRKDYEALLEQMKTDVESIESAVQKLQAQQLSDKCKEQLDEILRSVTSLHATTYCELPFYGPEEQ